MTRANYSRNESGNAIVYAITPIPASQASAFGAGPVMLALQAVVIFFLGLIPGGLVGAAVFSGNTQIVAALIVAAGITVLFVRWMRRYKARTMGTRQKAQVSIQDDAVHIARPDGAATVPIKAIRRLVIGNTYEKNLAPETTIIKANPSTGQVAGAAIRANVDQKLPQFCFSLELQHGNDSNLIADGLDELTVSNLCDDLGRDLQMEPM